jgi:nitroreductase
MSLNTQIHHLIRSRRTCFKFLDLETAPVEKHILESCIETATYAPNHKLTQPWRFWVIGEQSKNKLAHIYADNRASKNAQGDDHCYQILYNKAIQKFAQIPMVVMVGQIKNDSKLVHKEDYAACSCAIQNFQLAAWTHDIGVQWSTGPIINDPRTFELLKADQQKIELIGALYLGKIDQNCIPNLKVARKPVNEVSHWLD